MDVRLFSLSGDHLETIKVLSSDKVSDVKEQLYKSKGSASVCRLQLLLGGAVLDDFAHLQDLTSSTHADLQVVWSRKSAREMLFDSPEIAIESAEHYDALQDQCVEQISSLFLNEVGIEWGCKAKMEVLIALRQKLRRANCESDLKWLKSALAQVALGLLDEYRQLPSNSSTKPPLQHVQQLVRCFPWFGLEALQTLYKTSSYCHITLAKEYSTYPVSKLVQMLNHLQCPVSQEQYHQSVPENANLVKDLQDAISEKRKKERAEQQSLRSKCLELEGRLISEKPAQSAMPKLSTSTLNSPVEVLACARREAQRIHAVSTSIVEFDCPAAVARYATRDAVLEAVKLQPEDILQKVDEQLALAAVKIPGTYHHLPEELKMKNSILYIALEHDRTLQEEFMSTAGKTEIHQWQWHSSQQPSKRKRR